MITLESLKKLLGGRGQQYSDNELEIIRHDLYLLAHLSFKYYLNQQKILIKKIKNYDEYK